MTPLTVTIHQPQYLPWIPYFDKILQSDVFVFLDHVQFQKNGLQNRNQIKTSQGALWLTVPVKQSLGTTIQDTEIANPMALSKHLKTIELNYSKALHYAEGMECLRSLGANLGNSLSLLNEMIIRDILGYLGYAGKIVKSSEMKVAGAGSDLILNICQELRATRYLSGAGGKNYMQMDTFSQANIEVVFQQYQAVTYPQLYEHKLGFIADLSIIDLIFNTGKACLKIIESGRIH